MDNQLQRVKLELKQAQEECKKYKYNLQQTEQQKQYEIDDLQTEIKTLKSQCENYKTENDKFRNFMKERGKAYTAKEYPSKNYEASYEHQKKRVSDLMNYRGSGKLNGSYTNSNGDTNTRGGVTEPGDEYSCPVETPSRSIYQPSSEEAFLRSAQRNYTRKQIPDDNKSNEETNKSKSSNDRDRNVYTGFNEPENIPKENKPTEEEESEKQQKLLQSIERRVGGKPIYASTKTIGFNIGYEPVFCKLDTNQNEHPMYKTPQVRFRNFVEAKKTQSLDEKDEGAHHSD